MVHDCVHRNLVHISRATTSFLQIHFNISSHLHLGLLSVPILSNSNTKILWWDILWWYEWIQISQMTVTHNNCSQSSLLCPMHTTRPAHHRLLWYGQHNHAAPDSCQHFPMRTSLMSWAKPATGTTEDKQFFGSVPRGLEYKNDARSGTPSFPRKVQHLWLRKIVWKN